MSKQTLHVRIHLKTGAESFYRCGMSFSRDWKQVEVDAATAQRLHEEQMLEVSTTDPTAAVVAVPAPARAIVAVEPADQAERLTAIYTAIGGMDKGNETLWKKDGAPTTEALSSVLGWIVTAAERDAAWAEAERA